MAATLRYLLERDGRFYARLVVPRELRPYLGGRTELRTPLGADKRGAIKAHPAAVAELQRQIIVAENTARRVAPLPKSLARFPLTVEQIALRNYEYRLEQDEHARNERPAYATIGIDDGYSQSLRDGIAGKLTDAELSSLVEHRIAFFRGRANTDACLGSPEWRRLARAVCASEYEALERVFERDEGNMAGQPRSPVLLAAEPIEVGVEQVSLKGLFDDYFSTRRKLGKGEGAEKRWRPVFPHLCKFLKHDDASSLTKKDVMAWRNHLLETKAPKTVRDVWLTALKAVLNWAVSEDRLAENVAKEVRQELSKKILSREQGYTKEEAEVVLAAAWNYVPKADPSGRVHELSQTSAAKKWVPLLCAFTGARVTEMTQLRQQDLRQEGDVWVIRINPLAGSVKTNQYRDVPLHTQLVELGFTNFVATCGHGPLFYRSAMPEGHKSGAQAVSGTISEWLRQIKVVPKNVSPSHGWRHRFTTIGREVGASDRVINAICGHAGRTSGDLYGDATVTAKMNVIRLFPDYQIS